MWLCKNQKSNLVNKLDKLLFWQKIEFTFTQKILIVQYSLRNKRAYLTTRLGYFYFTQQKLFWRLACVFFEGSVEGSFGVEATVVSDAQQGEVTVFG